MLPFFFNQKHSRGCHLFGTGLSSLPPMSFCADHFTWQFAKIFHSLVLLNITFQNGLFSQNVSKTHKWMSFFFPVTPIPDQMVHFSDFFFNEQIPHRHFIVYLEPTCLPRMEKSYVPSWISLCVLCLALTEEYCYCHGVQFLRYLNRWSQGTPRATNHIKLPLGSRS